MWKPIGTLRPPIRKVAFEGGLYDKVLGGERDTMRCHAMPMIIEAPHSVLLQYRAATCTSLLVLLEISALG